MEAIYRYYPESLSLSQLFRWTVNLTHLKAVEAGIQTVVFDQLFVRSQIYQFLLVQPGSDFGFGSGWGDALDKNGSYSWTTNLGQAYVRHIQRMLLMQPFSGWAMASG